MLWFVVQFVLVFRTRPIGAKSAQSPFALSTLRLLRFRVQALGVEGDRPAIRAPIVPLTVNEHEWVNEVTVIPLLATVNPTRTPVSSGVVWNGRAEVNLTPIAPRLPNWLHPFTVSPPAAIEPVPSAFRFVLNVLDVHVAVCPLLGSDR